MGMENEALSHMIAASMGETVACLVRVPTEGMSRFLDDSVVVERKCLSHITYYYISRQGQDADIDEYAE